MREILFVAGEASGDANAAAVARELLALDPKLGLVGVGGEQMRAAGVRLMKHIDTLTVMGFVGVLKQIPRHWGLLHDIEDRLRLGNVALVILVDYGGFNLHVAATAKSAGVPVLYFVTPQVWASRAGRIRAIAESVTRAAVIFRFEEDLLRRHGVDAVFVGHPLMDRMAAAPSREEARAQLGIDPRRKLLALFPGSRPQELDRILQPFIETARRLQASDPMLEVIVAGAPTARIDPARCPYRVVASSSLSILRAADAALCKSGTTTLEAAVAGCPYVIGYRVGSVDFAIASQFATVDHIGMVNIIAGRSVVPEFLQDDMQPERMAQALTPLLDAGSSERAVMVAAFDEVRESLGAPGASRRVAALALQMGGKSS